MPFRLDFVGRPSGNDDKSWVQYMCGYCNAPTNGAVVAFYPTIGDPPCKWVCCPVCTNPSAITSDGRVFPAVLFGFKIQGLPPDVQAAYDEARSCFSANAFTGCELLCRKILMHIAVDKKADERKPFAFYIDYLEKEGYITPPMKRWVVLIKDHGNEATHILPAPSKDRAEGTLMFTAELLRLVYEMQYMADRYAPAPAPPTTSP